MRNKTLFILIFLVLGFQSQAQQEVVKSGKKRGQYSLDVYVGGGISYYLTVKGLSEELRPEINNWSSLSSLRIMWHPDHRIKLGIETGKIRFLSYDFQDSIGQEGKIVLNGIPVLAEWSMSLTKKLNVFAGSGVYFLTTEMDYAGHSRSKKLSLGWMAALCFIQPLNKDLSIGAELKWMDAAETTDGLLALQLQFIWKFIKW